MNSYRIGIDVGGTNTDAVILDNQFNVISEAKLPTTTDVSSGIYQALHKVIDSSDVEPDQIDYAMLGTTHCTNAIVERKGLNSIAIIRLGAPATLATKPLVGAPDDLRKELGKYVFMVEGGHEFDGREISPLDEEELYRIARSIEGKVDSVAITSVFSPVSNDHEERAANIVKKILGDDVPISLSSEIGSTGLLERENATILNASVVQVARKTVNGFIKALKEKDVHANVFFGQNDGTLMSADYALKYPILTVACGPTNSLRGASYLTGKSDAIVVDVGGTTTDVGVLVGSFPRESTLAVDIGAARTNFRMPDLVSLGLGGGTIIRVDGQENYTIGPDSVGHEITQKALVFGGDTLTATDVVVALNKADIGDPSLLSHLDQTLLEAIYTDMMYKVEVAIDRMKTSADDVPVILVGGGSILVSHTMEGASEVIQTNNHEVANAIGSAIAQVSRQIEQIYKLDELGREETIRLAEQTAVEEAVKAGADRNTCQIVDIEDIPLAYLPGDATRIRVKAAGNLQL